MSGKLLPRLISWKPTELDREHMRLIGAWLRDNLGANARVTDAMVVRFALDRAARGIYQELTGETGSEEAKST